MSISTNIFEILVTEHYLQERLTEIIPESVQFKSHYLFGVTNEVVYRFRENFDVMLIPIPTSQLSEIAGANSVITPIRRKSKRKKDKFIIASIDKILSKV